MVSTEVGNLQGCGAIDEAVEGKGLEPLVPLSRSDC
jgi:hypothetical protein